MNQPYVKQYSEKTGRLLNPIVGSYVTNFPSRRKKREFLDSLKKKISSRVQIVILPSIHDTVDKKKKTVYSLPIEKNRRKFKFIYHKYFN